MKLNIFSYFISQVDLIFLKCLFQAFTHFSTGKIYISCRSFFTCRSYIFWIQVFCHTHIYYCKYLLPIYRLPFVFNFNIVQFIYFSFIISAFSVLLQTFCLLAVHKDVLWCFLLKVIVWLLKYTVFFRLQDALSLKIWEEYGGASYSLNVAYLACYRIFGKRSGRLRAVLPSETPKVYQHYADSNHSLVNCSLFKDQYFLNT